MDAIAILEGRLWLGGTFNFDSTMISPKLILVLCYTLAADFVRRPHPTDAWFLVVTSASPGHEKRKFRGLGDALQTAQS